ncbi:MULTISPECIES: biotin/lipoyl-binding protein [unclassified Mesorhizobium]|uniref:HlyD family secretion protein n=1 Tax=unclassified Mesorhizobium TaxID=325217 RepID=UPI000FCB47FD|nr:MULTISPECIES: biotin/lipoyl-binding protein [unclassified Mesorhizobium]TIT77146.1 MAG: HlyD family secretion protein [Mesorhizobium sp.]TGP24903.1 HlyD family secretion protein [Mesorhizobium sp. M1D.F.Ca.ET.231.01.1.1]TGP36225.1 HlyD family secretion protein [Mesorhizobium sp. M1D.F.Ca.ET.234.01.1.1]TGS49728.1 HlyD family secretion protein [Mesorhizobium sp. M1D.F.Ca.ET.184.01.1.1]TGS64439.1 HlyD family secretion protein [Mesorhizobium sp. M1D.F.Ca.ET.183.01.1.1]
MLELTLCSLLTILPDYLFRRYVQGKRIGREITLYTMWYELRWGITACLLLTISLITLIFYYHPSTKDVSAVFRTVTILPETTGRVAEVFVGVNAKVKAGDPLFRLDSSQQEAARETAQRQIAETDAEAAVAQTELAAADGLIQQAQGAYQQALDELETKQQLMAKNANVVSVREIERLQNAVDGRKGAVDAAIASKRTLETKIASLLPAQKASAEAALAQAQVELDKTLVRAGVAGTVQQFTLRPGDVVNQMVRPAGILVPEEAGRVALIAGFGQIEAQVMKEGMIAEATCVGKPFTILPMVVTQVQDVIAAGQIRPTDQLVDVQQLAKGGTLTVYLEPLYPGELDGLPPGSSCIANAYTNNHDALAAKDISTLNWVFLHVVDTVAVVHAMILRIQALLLPVQTLVLGGH